MADDARGLDVSDVAFFITRIGPAESEVRQRTDDVEKYILRPALEPRGLDLMRSDKDPTPGRITDRIVRSIIEARVVIADVSGLNANVFYELGIAHSYRKPVIELVDDPRTIPFDIADQKHIVLGDAGTIGAREAELAAASFVAALDAVLAVDYVPSSPVSSASMQLEIARIDDPEGRAIAALQRDVERLQSAVDQISRSVPAQPRHVTEYFTLTRNSDTLQLTYEPTGQGVIIPIRAVGTMTPDALSEYIEQKLTRTGVLITRAGALAVAAEARLLVGTSDS